MLRRMNGLVFRIALFAALMLGCDRTGHSLRASAASATNAAAGESARVLGRIGDDVLVVMQTVWRAPAGGDMPERFELGLRGRDGVTHAYPTGGPVIDAVVWDQSVVVVDERHVMYLLITDGRRRQLDSEVFGAMAVSPDGLSLAYARMAGDEGEVHVRTRGGDVIVARAMASAGNLRFDDAGARLLFVGSRNGGVLGVYATRATDDQDVRCLTNCTLRAGREWEVPFVENPESARAFEIDAEMVSWATANQGRVSVRLGGAR